MSVSVCVCMCVCVCVCVCAHVHAQLCVSGQESHVHDTQVCYLQEPLSHHFQPLVSLSITAEPISIKFTYFMLSIHTKFAGNQLGGL